MKQPDSATRAPGRTAGDSSAAPHFPYEMPTMPLAPAHCQLRRQCPE
ncbi:hypothetical protein C7S14_1597 [Burkholderia cepacia]|nr:hypothetical protein C7S14_1597 [Burkholderia cepacia]